MINLILVFVCMILGIGLRRVKSLPQDAHTTLNTLILYVPLPAVILLTLPHLEWNLNLITLCLVAWIIFALSYLLFSFLGRKYEWDDKITGCLIITAGLCNSSFVGFPIIEALFGKEALKHAVLIDQPGSFLIVSSIGMWVAGKFSFGPIPKRLLLKRIFTFAPFMAFLTALCMCLLGIEARGLTQEILERLGSTLTPLALISVGLQLRFSGIKEDFKYLALGLGYKLMIAPLIIYCIYQYVDLPRQVFQIVVMESAMAPMITGAILAASHGLHPRLAGMMVGIGVPLSFLTLGFWYWVIK